MFKRFITTVASAAIIAAIVIPNAAQAATTGTITANITAPVLATITVSSGSVTCDVSATLSLVSPCTSCADASTGTQHGALTVASASALSTSAVNCASWAANAGGNVLSLSDTLSFTLNSFLVPADTYTASN